MSPNPSVTTTNYYTEPEPVHIVDNARTLESTSDIPMIKNKADTKIQIVWKNVAVMTIVHAFFLYGTYLLLSFRVMIQTILFSCIYILFSGFGVTGGAHRLWAHRTYKANLPLRMFLMLAHTAAGQNNLYVWARDHRVHHKFTDTNADPHNATRGFFFSHVGWLLCKKHKDVLTKGSTVDMSDVLSDPVVRFQIKYYFPLFVILNSLLPTVIPWYCFGENGWTSFVMSIWRYAYLLNGTWLVNSAAHKWGSKPYDITINPAENKMVSWIAFGEGWHNYHHVFPWDYKTAELGNYNYNFTTGFLDLMAKIGWATELKTASEEMIRKSLPVDNFDIAVNAGVENGNVQTHGPLASKHSVYVFGTRDNSIGQNGPRSSGVRNSYMECWLVRNSYMECCGKDCGLLRTGLLNKLQHSYNKDGPSQKNK